VEVPDHNTLNYIASSDEGRHEQAQSYYCDEGGSRMYITTRRYVYHHMCLLDHVGGHRRRDGLDEYLSSRTVDTLPEMLLDLHPVAKACFEISSEVEFHAL
jgi:hypothetical protein